MLLFLLLSYWIVFTFFKVFYFEPFFLLYNQWTTKEPLRLNLFILRIYSCMKKSSNTIQSLNFLLKEAFFCHLLYQPLSIHPSVLPFNWDHHFLPKSNFPTIHLPQLYNSHNCCNVLNAMATAAKSWVNIDLQFSEQHYYFLMVWAETYNHWLTWLETPY